MMESCSGGFVGGVLVVVMGGGVDCGGGLVALRFNLRLDLGLAEGEVAGDYRGEEAGEEARDLEEGAGADPAIPRLRLALRRNFAVCQVRGLLRSEVFDRRLDRPLES